MVRRYYEKDLNRIPVTRDANNDPTIDVLIYWVGNKYMVIWEPHYNEKGGKWVLLDPKNPDAGTEHCHEVSAHLAKHHAVDTAKRLLIDEGYLEAQAD